MDVSTGAEHVSAEAEVSRGGRAAADHAPVGDSLVEMLAAQLEYQRSMGHDFAAMSDERRIAWVKDMYIAAVHELGEALDEVSWKPWTDGPPRFTVLPFIAELGDAFQFIMNMWFAAMPHATPAEVATAMHVTLDSKLLVNRARVADGYDGVSTKCPGCRRALDDPHVTCRKIGPYRVECAETQETRYAHGVGA